MAIDADLPPTFQKGQELLASDLNLIIQRVRALIPLTPGGFVNGAFTVSRPLNSGGSEASNITLFAEVIEAAGANCSSAGRAILLGTKDSKLVALSGTGEEIILDENDPDYDEGVLEENSIVFFSAHKDSACLKGARIQVSSNGQIVLGAASDPDHPILGVHIDASAYCRGHSSFGPRKYWGSNDENVLFRDWETGSVTGDGSGNGACNPEGGIDIDINVSISGGPFVIPPSS